MRGLPRHQLAMEALSTPQCGGYVASCRQGPLNSAATATLLDVLLETRRQRQPIDQIQPDAAQDGELAEMTEGVHTAQTRQRPQ